MPGISATILNVGVSVEKWNSSPHQNYDKMKAGMKICLLSYNLTHPVNGGGYPFLCCLIAVEFVHRRLYAVFHAAFHGVGGPLDRGGKSVSVRAADHTQHPVGHIIVRVRRRTNSQPEPGKGVNSDSASGASDLMNWIL